MSDIKNLHQAVAYLALISFNNGVDHLLQDWGVPGFEGSSCQTFTVLLTCNQPKTKFQTPKVNSKYLPSDPNLFFPHPLATQFSSLNSTHGWGGNRVWVERLRSHQWQADWLLASFYLLNKHSNIQTFEHLRSYRRQADWRNVRHCVETGPF